MNLRSWLKIFLPFVRLEFGGGGGGDGGEADRIRQEEAAEKRRIAEDINRIRAVFGETDADYTTLPSLYQPGVGDVSPEDLIAQQQDIIALEEARRQRYADLPRDEGQYYPESYEQWVLSQDETINAPRKYVDPRIAAEEEIARLQEQYGGYDPGALQTQAEAAAATRASSLEDVYGNIMDLYQTELGRQRDVERAKTEAALAKRGLYGSTVEEDIFERLGDIYGTKLTELEGRASGAVTDIEAADERAKLDLINLIQSGGDAASAMRSAESQLESGLRQREQEALSTNLANLFEGMSELYGQRQYVDQYNRGRREGASGVITPGSSGGYSGTIIG